MDPFTFATVCSGIGAPEVAWNSLDNAQAMADGIPYIPWRQIFASEIEAFPSAVLKHHYPDVPNYGDMTKYKEWPDHKLDLLCAGTPCQAFSVAGLRRSLEDERGNLTLTFLRIAERYRPKYIVWENVPGVLNTPDNAFGQFLSGLAGFDTELSPVGGRWVSAGFVVGPERVAAWRVLDAQFFGVPQRRRRVYIVAMPREFGLAPCQILFEPQGMRGDTEKSVKEGQGAAGFTPSSIGGYREGCGTVRTQGGDVGGGSETLVMAHGQGNAEIGDNKSPSLTCNHEAPICVHARQTPVSSDKALPCETGGPNAIAIKTANTKANGSNINESGVAPPLDQTQGQAVAFKVRGGCEGGGKGYLGCEEKAFTVSTSHDQDLFHDTIVRRLTPKECERLQGFPDNYTLLPESDIRFRWHRVELRTIFMECPECGYISEYEALDECVACENMHNMRYLGELIEPVMEKWSPDGPRYKALGNSMAVPVMRFLGERIQLSEVVNE